MVARQNHGFIFEQYIITKYNLIKSKNGSIYDAYYFGIPVQIKCIKYKSSIELSDYFRNKNKKIIL